MGGVATTVAATAVAAARALAGDGGHVVVSSRDPEAVTRAVDELGGPAQAVGVAADLAEPNTADRLVAAATEEWGRLDGVLDRLTELFVAELTQGTRDEPEGQPGPRAGMIKTAGSFHGLDRHTRAVLIAAAIAHAAVALPRSTGPETRLRRWPTLGAASAPRPRPARRAQR